MIPKSFNRPATAFFATLIALGLSMAVGCSSSPDVDDTPAAPAEPIEEPMEPAEPTEEPMEPHEDPYSEPVEEPPGAEPQHPGESMAPAQPDTAEVDDATLGKFADVVVATSELEGEIEERMSTVETQAEAQQVEAEIMAQVEQEVTDAGLSMQQYAQIAQQLQFDPDLGQRLRQELEERGEADLLERPAM